MTMLQSPRIPANNKLRLAILYALRYQKLASNAITSVVDALIQNGVSADRARVSGRVGCCDRVLTLLGAVIVGLRDLESGGRGSETG